MNDPDFQDWLNRHRAAFPSLDSDLERISKGGTAVTQVIATWRSVLRDVALPDAIEATMRLARGDDEPPRRIDDHARVIRAVARRISGGRLRIRSAPRMIDGQPVYDCHLCSDTGMRTVWHSRAVQAMHEGKFGGPGTQYTAAVACGCERGQQMTVPQEVGKGREPMERFDHARHCEYGDQKSLHDFAHRGPVAVAFNPADYDEREF